MRWVCTSVTRPIIKTEVMLVTSATLALMPSGCISSLMYGELARFSYQRLTLARKKKQAYPTGCLLAFKLKARLALCCGDDHFRDLGRLRHHRHVAGWQRGHGGVDFFREGLFQFRCNHAVLAGDDVVVGLVFPRGYAGGVAESLGGDRAL